MTTSNIKFSLAKIITGLTLGYAFAAAWVVYADIVFNNKVPIDAIEFNGLYPISLGISAIIAALLFDRNLKCLGFSKFKIRFLFISILIAGLLLLIPFSLNLIFSTTDISSTPKFDNELIFVGIPVLIILAIGEEIMWRGLLYSEFSKKFNFATTSIIIGILWTLWHYPVIIHTKFIYGDRPLWFALTAFTITVVSSSFVYNYLRHISGSVWTCILLHAFLNYFAFVLIEPLEGRADPNSIYFISDIGIFYMLINIAAAIWVTRHHNRAQYANP